MVAPFVAPQSAGRSARRYRDRQLASDRASRRHREDKSVRGQLRLQRAVVRRAHLHRPRCRKVPGLLSNTNSVRGSVVTSGSNRAPQRLGPFTCTLVTAPPRQSSVQPAKMPRRQASRSIRPGRGAESARTGTRRAAGQRISEGSIRGPETRPRGCSRDTRQNGVKDAIVELTRIAPKNPRCHPRSAARNPRQRGPFRRSITARDDEPPRQAVAAAPRAAELRPVERRERTT